MWSQKFKKIESTMYLKVNFKAKYLNKVRPKTVQESKLYPD